MSFQFRESHLKRLCELNFFPVPNDGMIFFGLRGCLLTDVDNCRLDKQQDLVVKDLNYTNPRCTLGQWLPKEGAIALFPGSIIPHRNYMKTALSKKGAGVNQLAAGYFSDYRKAAH